MARAATTADAFNAVAEPRRRQILDVLSAGERPVNDLVALLGVAQPLVSKHLRVGGKWRYVMTANAGFEVAFHGEYREIIPNERIVSTEVYEGAPDGEALTSVTFTEVDGRTTLTMVMQLANKADRDMVIDSGM